MNKLRLLKLSSVLVPAVASFSLATFIGAYALTNPATIAPRDFTTQQTGYIRVHIKATGTGVVANGLACVGAASASNCSVKVGAVPANAFLVRMTQQIVTNFNGSTTDLVGLGTTTAGVNVLAAASVHTGAGAISSPSFASGSSGTLLTTGIAQTGANGGYDLYVNYSYGGNVATAGEMVLILEYFAPNDGDCIATPMGTTPVAC